ncbi:MAG: VWA domain-containing protein [Alphaproteobacteria bacterium]|nr:VWA domain-containing protein [Alphaproteobacteria bacterium]
MTVPSNPILIGMVEFIEHLRFNGFGLGVLDTQQALNSIVDTRGNLTTDRNCLKILLTKTHEEWLRFDDLFEAYWFERGKVKSKLQKASQKSLQDNKAAKKLSKPWQDHLDGEQEKAESDIPQIEATKKQDLDGEASGRLIAADKSVLFKTDFRQFVDPVEIAEAEQLAYRLASAIRNRKSRRYISQKRGQKIDLRRTIRDNLKHGGEMIDLRMKTAPERPVRIVTLLDVSGSMKHYSRFFLQFVKGLVCSWMESDAYLFHTKLVRITGAIKNKNSLRAMTQLSLLSHGFGGGTKIGESLAVFNEHYAKQTVNNRTVVIILSDGYDIGAPEKMARELKQLKRRKCRIIWLNPLLGWKNYKPVTAAMQASLPHIDHFFAANTAASLAKIEPYLARL